MHKLLELWKALSTGLREGITAGLIVAVILALLALFRKSLVAGLKWLLLPQHAEQPQTVVVKVEVPQPVQPAQTPQVPAPTVAPPPRLPSIPRPPTVGFVARRDDQGRDILTRLEDEIAPGKTQLVAVWGPGGVGKTALASEAARSLAEKFRQRIVWSSADGRPDFELATLLDEVATQLGHPDLRQLALEPKVERLHPLIAEEPTLIVLDNFETILPKEQTRCTQWLNDHVKCPALITTRDRINSARNIPIDAMSPDEAREFLERLINQSASPNAFKGLDRDRMIQLTGANPLVLQWLVAQVELAQETQSVLAELAQGEGDAADRVFERSFRLPQVGDDGRAALLALSLFVPSASRPALAHVAGFGSDQSRLNEAIRHLAALRLVEAAQEGQRLTVQGLTRQLAKAHLSRHSDANKFRERFVQNFVRYARAHAATTAEDFDALEQEKDNLLTAIDLALEERDWDNVARIRMALEEFLDLRGYWEEAIRRGRQALQAARELTSETLVARFAHNLAVIHQRRGEVDEARRLYQESLDIKRKLGDENGIAKSLHQLGALAQDQGKVEEARRLYKESLEISRKLGDENGIAKSLHQSGTLAQGQGEIQEARRLYEQSLEIKRRLGDKSGIAKSLHQLGMLAHDQAEPAEAQRLYQQSLEINRKLGDESSIAKTLHQLGILAQNQGKIEESRQLCEESLRIARKLGDESGVAASLHHLGILAQLQGEIDEARRLYEQSLDINRKLGDQSGLANSLAQLGSFAEHYGNKLDALQFYREALKIFEQLRSPQAERVRSAIRRLEEKK